MLSLRGAMTTTAGHLHPVKLPVDPMAMIEQIKGCPSSVLSSAWLRLSPSLSLFLTVRIWLGPWGYLSISLSLKIPVSFVRFPEAQDDGRRFVT